MHKLKFLPMAYSVLAAVFAVALIVETVPAQIIPKIEYRNFRRAKLWTGLMNTGTHGPDRDGSRRANMEGIAYPGRGTRISGSIWGGRTWPGSNQWVQNYLLRTSGARNLGTYIITKPNPSEFAPTGGNTYNVSISALTHTPDITPVRYPVEDMPEGRAGVGFEHTHPIAQVPLASWWPGQVPLAADRVLEIHNADYGKYMKAEHKKFGELLGIAHWTTETGITGTKKVYQWSFRDWDDFVIVENIFENTGDSDGDGIADLNGGSGLTLNDTYFSFVNLLWPTEGGTANRDRVTNARGYYYWLLRRSEAETYPEVQDDVLRYTDAANYPGGADPSYSDVADAVGLKMHYAFDGDSPVSSRDDTGDSHIPETQCCWGRQNFQVRGEIMAGQYVGFMPIDYDPTDGFANDTETYVAPRVTEQPFAVSWFTHKDDPSIERGDHTEDDIARALVSVPLAGERPSILNTAGRTPWPENPTAPLPPQDNPTRSGETVATPMSPNWYSAVQTYGPYDLKKGDKVKIVTALVAAMAVEENMWGWQRDIPKNFDDLHTDKVMQNLVKHAKKAREIYDLAFDVPLPPPDVVLAISNTPDATAKLSWGSLDDLEDPDYAGTSEAKDVAGYRVYRSDFYIDNWQLLKDIPVGDAGHKQGDTYEFVDSESLAGFEYYYAVTAYDTGHSDFKGRGSVPSLESSLSAVEQFFPFSKTPTSPAVAANPVANALEAPVAVIPNPFLADGSHAYEGSDKIRFTNLPAKCHVKIFSVSGDLAAEFKHDNPDLGEASYLQLSREVTGQISAGVYFFVVKSEMPESMGKIQRGTFVVVGGSVR